MIFALVLLGYANERILPDTVEHVRRSLGALLESVQRETRKADDALQKTEHWCAATLSGLSAIPGRTSEMQMDLSERQAAASEFQALVTQIRADIDLTYRTINATRELGTVWLAEATDLKNSIKWSEQEPKARAQSLEATEKQTRSADVAIEELLDVKRTALSSLKVERELVQLAHEEAQWQAAELKRRLADRRNTITAERGFFEMLAYGCRGQDMRAAASATARAREVSAAKRAISALGRADAKPEAELPAAHSHMVVMDDPVDKDFELDFVQKANSWQAAINLDTAFLLHGSSDDAALQFKAFRLQDTSVRTDVVQTSTSTTMRVDTPQLSSRGSSDGEHRKFCVREQEHNYLVMRLAGDLMRQSEASIDAHSAAEMQLQDDLNELHVAEDVLNSILKQVTTATQLESKTLARMEKNRRFTSSTLNQAIDIFNGFKQDESLTQNNTASNIVSLLTSANVSCYQSVAASKGARNEAAAVAADIVAKAGELSRARRAEADEMEILRADHFSHRRSLLQTKQAYEGEVARALIRLDHLREECGSPAST